MFFRRRREVKPGFQERVNTLQAAGFTVIPQAGGAVRVSRECCAVDLKESNGALQVEDRAGILMGGEIAVLVDGGFQKFFRASSGKKKPALADELKALHDFEADLKEKLGLRACTTRVGDRVHYQYDRVKIAIAGLSEFGNKVGQALSPASQSLSPPILPAPIERRTNKVFFASFAPLLKPVSEASGLLLRRRRGQCGRYRAGVSGLLSIAAHKAATQRFVAADFPAGQVCSAPFCIGHYAVLIGGLHFHDGFAADGGGAFPAI